MPQRQATCDSPSKQSPCDAENAKGNARHILVIVKYKPPAVWIREKLSTNKTE